MSFTYENAKRMNACLFCTTYANITNLNVVSVNAMWIRNASPNTCNILSFSFNCKNSRTAFIRRIIKQSVVASALIVFRCWEMHISTLLRFFSPVQFNYTLHAGLLLIKFSKTPISSRDSAYPNCTLCNFMHQTHADATWIMNEDRGTPTLAYDKRG